MTDALDHHRTFTSLALDDRDRLAAFEAALLDSGLPVVHLPVTHRFTPGLYSREIFMPAGTLCASKLHRTTHQYVVLSGVVHVAIPGQDPVRLTAGHVGTTEAGTERALFIEETCRWVTFHPLTEQEDALRAAGASVDDLWAAIESRIIEAPPVGSRDVFAEYCQRLKARGLPMPNEGDPCLLRS